MEKQIVRKPTREVQIGSRRIGGKNPILIQSMTNTHTEDIKGRFSSLPRLAVKLSAVQFQRWKRQRHWRRLKKELPFRW